MTENPDETTSETRTATTDEATTGGATAGRATPEVAPTADLLTGNEPSEKLDAAFELLAEPLRREALAHLREVETESGDGETAERGDGENGLELASLAETVAADRMPDDAGTAARSVALELHHSHLPKLESHGVVTYDPERRTVRYHGHAWLDVWFEHVREAESE